MREGQHADVAEARGVWVVSEVERPGWEVVVVRGLSGGDTVREFGDFGLEGEGQAAEVHSENAPGVSGLGGAAEYEGRGSLGRGEGEFFADEVALGVGAVGVEVGVVA